ncbi:MAG: TIGR03915 family putative DNA repair protein [Calditerrivibrio sp.]|nr:TIGR03915 family putative DNA repair protein [Calditerrivibrio sp.]
MYQIVYDGTFDGFLTVFYEYKKGLDIDSVVNKKITPVYQPTIFSYEINTDHHKSIEAMKYIKDKGDDVFKKVYFSFLADTRGLERIIFEFVDIDCWQDLRNPVVCDVERAIKSVFSERHKMLGFIRFSELSDGSFVSFIKPKNNILPLIGEHFKKRFSNQRWTIVDKFRREVLAFDGSKLYYGSLVDSEEMEFSEKEMLIRKSWKSFFDIVAIQERKCYERQRNKVPLWVREEMIEFW